MSSMVIASFTGPSGEIACGFIGKSVGVHSTQSARQIDGRVAPARQCLARAVERGRESPRRCAYAEGAAAGLVFDSSLMRPWMRISLLPNHVVPSNEASFRSLLPGLL